MYTITYKTIANNFKKDFDTKKEAIKYYLKALNFTNENITDLKIFKRTHLNNYLDITEKVNKFLNDG